MRWLKKFLGNKGLEFLLLALLGMIVVLAYYYFTSPPAKIATQNLFVPKLILFAVVTAVLVFRIVTSLRSGNDAGTSRSRNSSKKSS
ncbi:MAG: hypothetical protein UMV23_01595 [Halanaerobium sp.]|nr:hypothetical protein [Halanaerobium sp.]